MTTSQHSAAITIEGVGFGDAEVYTDGLLTHGLVDCDRSTYSTGERFNLIDHTTYAVLGIVRPQGSDPVEQIRALIEEAS